MSYSHAADGRLAPALQTALHQFGKPWYRLRAMRVFRDDASLAANPGLWSSISSALAASDYFILLASAEAAQSKWVRKEVEYWCKHRSVERFLIALTGGDIVWHGEAGDFDWEMTSALPESLCRTFAESRASSTLVGRAPRRTSRCGTHASGSVSRT